MVTARVTARDIIGAYLGDLYSGKPRHWNGHELSTDELLEFLVFEGFAVVPHDANERSSMTFEQGLDHVVLNGHRIARPSGVSRTSWDRFWTKVSWQIIELH